MDASATAVRPPSLGALFLVFGKIGLFSFGGGSTTLVLMEQEVVRRRGWLTNHQFLFTMALSRMCGRPRIDVQKTYWTLRHLQPCWNRRVPEHYLTVYSSVGADRPRPARAAPAA